jgi:ectoine hydroxylase-related dioxygenase (phytanoyl-CoA dioxygenase family)
MSHQPLDKIERFPLITQVTNQLLTLQAAIAHTDMPYSTGPTRFMAYSQQYHKGYLAFKRPEYIDYVKPKMAQLELQRGDAVFFNPATFHQPGVNTTEGERSANLFQVNSAFSRPMETLDRCLMTKSVWPVFKRWHQEVTAGSRRSQQLDALIAATCDDYGYPRNNTKHKVSCSNTSTGA